MTTSVWCYRCGRECAGSFDLLRIGGKNVAVCKGGCPSDAGPGELTADELRALDLSASLVNTLSRVVGQGRTRGADLAEIVAPVHVIQHAVLSQAAARRYPERFRLLGESLPEGATG